MQTDLRKISTVTIIFLFALTVSVIATHTSSVSISPTESYVGDDVEFKVLVKNQDGDSINRFELLLPETLDGKPYYLVKEIGKPSGWNFEDTYKVGSSYPYKITWSTGGLGIAQGKSLEFSFKAQVPSTSKEFTWSWKTVDLKGGTKTGELTTKVLLAPFADFKITVPKNVTAGDYFTVTVTAMDKEGNIKTDFTGTVTFSSSDSLAVLPQQYTYKTADKGSKEFTFKLKTYGNQVINVKTEDKTTSSSEIFVKPADTIGIKIALEKEKVVSGTELEIKVFTIDLFGNQLDVSKRAKLSIDKEAGGKFVGNVYKADNVGNWTISANYTSENKVFFAGTTLTVVKKITQEEKEPKEKETIIVEEKELTISAKTLRVESNKTTNVTITVRNTGTVNLTNVVTHIEGMPENWRFIVFPKSANILPGKSQEFIIAISVPETNETGVKKVNITATSAEGIVAFREVDLAIGGVGFFSGVSRPVYIAIGVVALIIIGLIIWKLVPKEEKKKKSEE